MSSVSNLTVIVPTLNEEATIGALLERLFELYPGIHAVVVDDASTDCTARIVRSFEERIAESGGGSVRLLVRENVSSRGITASVLDALETVETEYFAVMDGDLQHPPEVLGELWKTLAEGAALVVGSRLPYREDQALHRTITTKVATLCAVIYLRIKGIKIADPMSGLFAGRTDTIRPLIASNRARFEPAGYKVLFDLLRLVDRTTPIAEVYYRFGVRSGGSSKLRPAHAFYFLRSLFK